MSGKFVTVGLLVAMSLATIPARAQDEPRQEISAQGTGFFTKDSNGGGIAQHSTNTGGFVASYRYHFSEWLAADASYGYIRNTQQNFTSSNVYNVQASIHEATSALVVTVPTHAFRFQPYVLAGAGALVFDPTGKVGGFVPGAMTQAKVAFVYGGGVDWNLSQHLAIRAEYRGFVYGRPDFGLPALHSGAVTNTAQPSAGIVFRF